MRLRHWFGAGLLFFSGVVHGALSPQQDQLLQQAADAFAQGNYQPAAAALPQLAHTYMGPWVAYWSLQPRLQTLKAAQFQTFSQEFLHGAAYLLLRRQWLLELGKRRDWQTFAEVYRAGPAPKNLSARCYAAHNPLLQTGDPATLWEAASASNGACNRMAQTALGQGQIPQTLLWHKLAEMILGGHLHSAMTFASFLPGNAASAVKNILQSPGAWLASQGGSAQQIYGPDVGAELLHLTLLAMLPNDSALAVAQSETLPGLLPAQRASICYSAALQAARRFQTRTANAWYQAALTADPSYRPNAEVLHWMVRSALLQQNWSLVLAAEQRLPADQAQQSQWQFWKALALQKTGEDALARQLWQQIASPFDAYGQLASAALGQNLRLPVATQSPTELVAEAFSQPTHVGAATNGSLRRALKLYQLGLYFDALWEWGQYLDTLSDASAIKAAARQAAQHQAWLLVINASTRIDNDADWQQGYVLPYRQDIIASANRNALSPSFVAGVIRQESGFAPGIRSSVGAQGIMQVMPATAAWVQSRFPQSAAADLQTAAGNIQIGTAYLAYLRSQFGDSPILLAAAYNAGPGAVNRWLQKISLAEGPWAGLIFAANIPYQQTRDYVLAVLSNAIVYRMLLSESSVPPLSYWQLAR
ncbi:lytic transglycosylase domain-containing protein [Acidithiobacillus sp. AMEEHan]|uniref:lytic transglycosylase domain-containing protein n=1 Tax=Acidithiobacillus sp. AMEEHan TaxID=2994951 RepID=UPI0027E45BDF|nr:lytic transglycosylase domain-containing protein [Acidithiobacillus sp. AMEEHan]